MPYLLLQEEVSSANLGTKTSMGNQLSAIKLKKWKSADKNSRRRRRSEGSILDLKV